MNTTIISGRLVRNPGYNEVENEKGLLKIAKFVMAVRRNYSDDVSFIPVKAFAKKAEFVRDYLVQGTKVMVEGERVWLFCKVRIYRTVRRKQSKRKI